jgi:hypothetical protein
MTILWRTALALPLVGVGFACQGTDHVLLDATGGSDHGGVTNTSGGWGPATGGADPARPSDAGAGGSDAPATAGTSGIPNVAGTGGASGGTASGGAATGGVISFGGSSGGSSAGGTTNCPADCSTTSCPDGYRGVCVPTTKACVCAFDCMEDPLSCGAINHCPSVCDANVGTCVCAGSCIAEGQIGVFSGCCSGLDQLVYYPDITSCSEPTGPKYTVCTACGDQRCGPVENRCNCPADCA